MMRTFTFTNGQTVPNIGLGTWGMGEGRNPQSVEVEALRTGIELGMTLIDTAEMYGNGGSERVVREAIKGQRKDIFLVSKVLPYNASAKGTIDACEQSLKNLDTDVIDLYLLHWPGPYPLSETINAFDKLITQGKIKSWGVSNFDTSDMEKLASIVDIKNITTNQILYNLTRRNPEYDLIPWCENQHIPLMAYSPIEQGRLLNQPKLVALAKTLNTTPAIIALAWIIKRKKTIAIPKATTIAHIKDNRKAAYLTLSAEAIKILDKIFSPPTYKVPLEAL